MKRIVCFFVLGICFPFVSYGSKSYQNSPYFNTKFLSQYDLVTKKLKEEDGFSEGFFSSTDNYKLNYLFLERPNAEFNAIICAGWLPGRKEGMATIYKLLPQNCNILLFDARGHGKSEGSIVKNLFTYGNHDYKDILGAIKFVNQKSTNPIIVYGTCSGAFNAAHALLKLQQYHLLNAYNVKGLVFDSGWTDVSQASQTVIKAHCKRSLLKFLNSYWYRKKNYKNVRNTLPYGFFSSIISNATWALHGLLFKPFYSLNDTNTNLKNKLCTLKIPILFIHSEDDSYVYIDEVKNEAKKCQNKMCWWIEKSSHANHCLKYPELYQEKLELFCTDCLS